MLSRLMPLQAIVFILSLFFILPVSAHEVRPAIVDINLDDQGQYKMTIKVNLEALISKVETNVNDTNDSENAAIYDALREMPAEDLAQELLMFEESLLPNIHLKINKKEQKLTITSIDIPDVGDLALARDSVLNFKGNLPAPTEFLSWSWDSSFGNAAFRVGTSNNPELYSAYLKDGKESDIVSLKLDDNCDTKNSKNPGGCNSQTSGWDTFINYISVGFTHIVPLGIDHILFVVGLFLLSATLRPLLIQITTFTVAHSVTLALGMFGVINISPSIVEPLIAASIVYVCVENIYMNHITKWRPVVVFAFGLLHGLGFASVLTEFGLAKSNYVSGLIGFNVGVELGQLAVITGCFLLIGIWFRNKHWYRQRITIPASIIIALIAVYWFIERVGWI